MNKTVRLTCAASVILAMASAPVGAAEVIGAGPAEFESRCAVCHGLQGRGDGPFAPLLLQAPADLTKLTRGNGGDFPAERIRRVIDGRELIASHGPREMPIWGRELLAEYQRDSSAIGDPETYVHERIDALVDYLRRLQVH